MGSGLAAWGTLGTRIDDPELLEKYQPGPYALLLTVVLLAALWFLLRSLNKHLRRVRFEDEPGSPEGAQPAGDASRSRARGASVDDPAASGERGDPASR